MTSTISNPLALIAELTHRCPLHCVYCSNPLELQSRSTEISGTKSHTQKLRVLEWVKQHRVALTLNFVIHHRNIDQLEEMVALAETSSATRIEFANVQYYGWAFANRETLLPTREQLAR